MRLAALTVLFLSASALAQERWDHNGSIGVHAGFGVEGRASIGVARSDLGARLFPELGATVAIANRWELKAAGRLTFLGPLGLAFLAGVRSTFGERFKTFFDLDLNVHAIPIFTIGPRVAFGVQYEFSSVFGAFASAGLQFGVGPAGVRLGFETMIGVQARSYLLE